jgi:hypothetical protein
VTDRPVLSDEQLCAVARAVLGDDYTDPDGEDLALSRAIEQAALRELAQGVDVEELAQDIDVGWDSYETVRESIAAALTRAIAGERAKASAREAQAEMLVQQLEEHICSEGGCAVCDTIAFLRAQLLGAPDGR